MSSFPPEMEAFLERERREQTNFVKLTMAKQNVNQATQKALKVMDTLVHRGEQINVLEKEGETLMQSSNMFKLQVMPWWKKLFYCECLPRWWFRKENQQHQDFEEYHNFNFK